MEYIVNSNDLTSVANAIRTKGETSAPLAFPNGFVSAIEDIPTGGGGAEVQPLSIIKNGTYTAPEGTAYSPVVVNVPIPDPSDYIYQDNEGYVVLPSHKAGNVRFIDYDGTPLYSFSKDDIDEMESLPANPVHDGLIAQGWNWSLADIKSYLTDYPDAVVNIGQMYITDDDNTRIYITLDDPDALSPYLAIAVNGEVSVDWGDGSTSDTMTGSSNTSLIHCQHVYDNVGNYIISIEVVSGKFTFYGSTNYPSCLSTTNLNNNKKRSRLYSKAITKIYVGDNCYIGNYAFSSCSSITSITIHDNIVSIGSNAFRDCISLKSITIADSITSIGSNVFNGCRSLASIAISNNITIIDNNAFANCYSLESVAISDSITSIGNSAFSSCYSLLSVTIPDGITSIGTTTFGTCTSLKSITIPDGVISIGSNAFSYCTALESVTIPDSVTSIGGSAFADCKSLTSIIIPDSVTSIESYTFQNCYSLKSMIIPDDVSVIRDGIFSNCYSLKSVTIPNGVTSIGDNAFSNCSFLQSITIPDGVTSIGSGAFNSCYSLKSMIIPNGITSIAQNIFAYCYSMTMLIIPDSVESIGASAFSNSYNITEYHLKSDTPPTLTNINAFTGMLSDTIIYVPYSSDHSILEAYKAATNWSTYASYIQEEPAP